MYQTNIKSILWDYSTKFFIFTINMYFCIVLLNKFWMTYFSYPFFLNSWKDVLKQIYMFLWHLYYFDCNCLISSISIGLFAPYLLVGSFMTKENTLLSKKKKSFSCASNLGRTITTKNMNFCMNFTFISAY
jgi:hypothetical protein